MQVLVLGASGRNGQLVVDEALSKGYHVTALVRSSASVPAKENLTVVEGTPLKTEDIEKAFSATATMPSAVLVSLRARRASDSPFAAALPDTPTRLMADSVANAITVMKKFGVRRLVVNSCQGVGDSFAQVFFLFKLVFTKTNMKYGFDDHNALDVETRKQAADIDFTLVRPVMLAEGEAAEVKVFPDNGAGAALMPKLTRASLAKFMVEIIDNKEYYGRSPVISN